MTRSASRTAVAAFASVSALIVSGLPPLASRSAPPVALTQQQAPPSPRQQPVFRAGATFVRVDVYPRRDGRIVEGLTPGDFAVTEDGRPQTIEAFEFIRHDPITMDADRRDRGAPAKACAKRPIRATGCSCCSSIHTASRPKARSACALPSSSFSSARWARPICSG